MIYNVYFPGWDINIAVPMPQMPVFIHLARKHKSFGPGLHREYLEAYIQDYEVRPSDALAYALTTFHDQTEHTQSMLKFRLGPYLEQATEFAEDWWEELFDEEYDI